MDINKSNLESRGFKEGVQVKNMLLNAWKTKHEYDFPEKEIITGITEDEEGVKIRTDYLDSLEEINGTKIENEHRFYLIDSIDLIEIVKNEELPDKINGEDYESNKDFFDFEFISLPKPLIKAFKDVFAYINSNKEDLEEVLDVNEMKLSVDGFDISIGDLEKLYNGIDKIRSNDESERISINIEEGQPDTGTIYDVGSDTPTGPGSGEFV